MAKLNVLVAGCAFTERAKDPAFHIIEGHIAQSPWKVQVGLGMAPQKIALWTACRHRQF